MKNKTVAIIGKPNVGKSSLFNRLIKERKSIVDDQPGVTKDRLYGHVEWLNQTFNLIDTGGITKDNNLIAENINLQANIALNEADIIIFVLDYKNLLDNLDDLVAKKIKKMRKDVILVINKYDKQEDNMAIYNCLQYGFGEPIKTSTVHGIGIGDLLDEIILKIGKSNINKEKEDIINFTIIGKPNVGKSSLNNALLKEDRTVVSEKAGTTTDSVDTVFKINKQKYKIIDTAGVRRRGKILPGIEKYSLLRTIISVDKSDIILLVIDASEELSLQDTNVASLGAKINKPIIIIANKIDLLNKNETYLIEKEKEIKKKFKFLKNVFIIFTSIKDNKNIHKVIPTIDSLFKKMHKRVSTSALNEVINRALLLNPPSKHNKGILKIYYLTQAETYPPTFIIFCNNPDYIHFSYKRYIKNQINQAFDFDGVPIILIFKKR